MLHDSIEFIGTATGKPNCRQSKENETASDYDVHEGKCFKNGATCKQVLKCTP